MGERPPNGWTIEPLCNVARVVSGGTPSRYVAEFWEGGTIRWVTPTDLTATAGRILWDTTEKITELGLRSCSAALLPPGSLLMSSRATLGEIRIAGQEVCTNQGFKSLVPADGTDGRYLYYQMLRSRERYRSLGVGSTFLEVNKRDTERFRIPVAPPDEQPRIAEVLSAVDHAIEQTEALIAKMQQVKAGLMHDLFSRGVLPDGQLRPPRDEAPELYKESPLGWIPKEWEVTRYEALCEMLTVGIVVRPTQYYVADGVPAFRSANIREDGIDPTDLVFISPEANALLSKSRLRAGDMLTVRTGYPGTSAIVPAEFAGANCIDLLVSRPAAQVGGDYVAAWMNSPVGKEQVLRKQGGLAQQHFNAGELREVRIAVPAISEQEAIMARLTAHERRIAHEHQLGAKWQALKSALMHDLLTGRVRVPVPKDGGSP